MKLQSIAVPAAILMATATLAACGTAASSSEAASGCTPAHTFNTVAKGTLSVVSYDLPPFSKIEGNNLTGVDGDILASIAKKECLTITLKSAAVSAVVPTVQSGRADVAAGDWYRTAARTQVVSLTGPLYLDQMALVSKDGEADLAALKGKSIGTVDGYLWVADLKKYFGGHLKVYSTSLNMYEDLKAGRLDVGTDSYGSAVYTVKDLKVVVAKSNAAVAATQQAGQTCFPATKNNPGLLTALNEDIAEMHTSGELAKLLTKNGLDASAAETGDPRLIS